MSVLDAVYTTAFPVAVAGCVLVAVAGGWLTDAGQWYRTLRMPSWRPPSWAFGPAWTLIFACIAMAATIAWNDAPDVTTRSILIALFVVNGILNIAWSGLFFKMRRPDWAFHELVLLWLSVLSLVVFTRGFAPTATWLLAPYLGWVAFAGLLNHRIVALNAPFGPTFVSLDRREST